MRSTFHPVKEAGTRVAMKPRQQTSKRQSGGRGRQGREADTRGTGIYRAPKPWLEREAAACVQASRARGDSFPATLLSAERSPAIPPADDLYGWLIGSWELEVTAYDDEGDVTHSTGEAHFAWVLEGRAIQDVFINPHRTERGPHSPRFANWYGTTLRIYDPSISAWRVNWFNPHDGIRAELIGRRRGHDIVQEGKFPDGTSIRWSFSEITKDSCLWRGERLERDGKTWKLQVEFRAKRVG